MPEGLDRLFSKGTRAILLPIDHGTALPVPELANPAVLIAETKPWVDAYVVNYGFARAFAKHLSDSDLCLRTDVYKPGTKNGAFTPFGVDEANEIGADAMMQMLFPGHPNEADITLDCCETILEGIENELPTIVETLPKGLGMPEEYTVEQIGFAARQAAELGAGAVKTAFPTGASVEEFSQIVESCFVPLIVLGGAAMGDDKALLTMVRDAMDAGAKGIAVGRNVWQHSEPGKIAQRLHAIVHDDVSVAEALAL